MMECCAGDTCVGGVGDGGDGVGDVYFGGVCSGGEGDGNSGTTCAHGIKDEFADDGGCEFCDCGRERLGECCECGRERLGECCECGGERFGECCESESLVDCCEDGTEWFVDCCEGGTEWFVDCCERAGEARLGEWCSEGGTEGECFTPLARGRFMSTKAEIVRSTRLRLLLLAFNLFRILVIFL